MIAHAIIKKSSANLYKKGVDLVNGQDKCRLLLALLEGALCVVVCPHLDGTGERGANAVLDVGPCVGLGGTQHAK